MITIDDKIECDGCGKFIKRYDKLHIKFTPDSEFTEEKIEHFCEECSFELKQMKEKENKI